MCRAAYLGFKNIVALLLAHGADINIRSSDGRSPLMWAAFRNNVKMAEFLLDSGA
jgi:ankyrin repeat protein